MKANLATAGMMGVIVILAVLVLFPNIAKKIDGEELKTSFDSLKYTFEQSAVKVIPLKAPKIGIETHLLSYKTEEGLFSDTALVYKRAFYATLQDSMIYYLWHVDKVTVREIGRAHV